MLKRNVSVAVAAALALSLAACGSSPASSAASSEAVSSEAASSEATAAPAAGDFDVDQDITVISREDGSGTRGAFIELTGVEAKNDAGEKVDNTTEAAAIQSSTNGVLTAVSNDETAIGYISLGSLNNDVKAVTVEGVAPSADTVKDGTYTLARPFNIVTNGEAADPVAVDFIAYCMSTDGQALATEEGYIGDVGADYTSTQPAGKIVVGGSSSVSPLMEKLIEAYAVSSASLPLVVVAFIVAALVRISVGSSTVAMTMAAGIIAAMPGISELSPLYLACVTAAIAGGSTVCSHFNDSGFWLVKSLVGMDEKTTLKTWTIMETLVGGVGFLVALVISFFA